MKSELKPVFERVDCIRVYVPNLDEGLKLYCEKLGLNIIWKTENAIGLGMADNITEVVVQNKYNWQEVDIKVDSVMDSVEKIKDADGEIVCVLLI